ncbi:MAG: hypothetical protein L0Z46_11920 [Nitrospiraceae bacterium]|nr:hypothetical protein [Nitrospiraceae bacterium]
MKRHILIGLAATMILGGGLPAHGLAVEKAGLFGEAIKLCDPSNRSTDAESKRCDEAIKRWQQGTDSSEVSAASPSPDVAQSSPQSDVSSPSNQVTSQQLAELIRQRIALRVMWAEQCAHYNLPCGQAPWERDARREVDEEERYKNGPLEAYLGQRRELPLMWVVSNKFVLSTEQVDDYIVRMWCTPQGILCDLVKPEKTPHTGITTEYWCMNEQLHWRREPGCEAQKTKYTVHLDNPLVRLLELMALAIDEGRMRADRDAYTKWWNDKRQHVALAMQNYCDNELNQKLDSIQHTQDIQSRLLLDQFTYQWMWNSFSLPPWNQSR